MHVTRTRIEAKVPLASVPEASVDVVPTGWAFPFVTSDAVIFTAPEDNTVLVYHVLLFTRNADW